MAIDVLARDLGVSQTPIREALARLESEGLVIRKENGRYRTEPLLTKNSFHALYEVRLLLEPSAAERRLSISTRWCWMSCALPKEHCT